MILNFISLFKYFTTWVNLVNLIYLFTNLGNYYSIVFINLIMIICATIVLYKNNNKLNIKLYDTTIYLAGILNIIVYVLTHYILFLLVLFTPTKKNNMKISFLIALLPIIYLAIFGFNNILLLYNASKSENIKKTKPGKLI